MSICLVIGLVTGVLFPNRNQESIKGLVWGTIGDAIKHYKGSEGTETMSDWALVDFAIGEEEIQDNRPVVYISPSVSTQLNAQVGDILYVSDSRAWLGGLRSTHAIIGGVSENLTGDNPESPHKLVILIPDSLNQITGRKGHPLRIKRMY